MPDMTTKSFPQILADQATAAQASAGRPLDFSTGGLLRALSEAIGSLALWLQAEVLKVLSATRLATSTGADADSFVADFGLTRITATAAAGEVTMSRFTTGLAAAIPVGTTLRTSDGQVAFTVAADATYAGWDASLPGYRLAAGASSIAVPIVAQTTGTAGNVDAGTVSLLTTPISGIDTVVNAAPASGGADAETDAALRIRFPAYIASLSQVTKAAVGYAVSQVQPGLFWAILEGTGAAAYDRDFVVVVNNGSSVPSGALLTAVASAVEPVRGLGVSYAVVAATIVPANVSMSITSGSGISHADTIAIVSGSVRAYLGSLSVGETLSYSRLVQVAYTASTNALNVTGLTLNGGTADLAAAPDEVIRPGTVSVS